MIRVLLADDHLMVRRGLAQILEESPGIIVAGEASNGQEVVEALRTLGVDVVILDISMPVKGGLDVLRELKVVKPGVKVIVLTMHPEEQYAIRSLRDGASAYLTKGSGPEELVEAIHTVAAGKRYITPAVADRLAGYVEDSTRRPLHESLSDRELQVLVRIASGKQASEIAGELNLSIKTVSTYRSRILQKMNMQTNAQLMRYALQHDLA